MGRITIIGLGVIGGSIALGLKQAAKEIEIAGVSRTPETASRARRAGAIDLEPRSIEEAVAGAQMVILASPILSIAPLMEAMAPHLSPDTIVTDAASTKGVVARWAREKLPAGVHFVGGHPMAGKEITGFDAAEAELFSGKPWVIAPSVDAPEAAVNAVIGLAEALGARPVFMDAEEHDAYVAAVSHLPLTVASALFSMAFESQAWPELAALASSGFRDTTRLASGAPELAHDIVQTNRRNLLHWIDRFQQELARYRNVIESGDSRAIAELFAKPQLERDNYLINGPPKRESERGEAPRIGISDFLLGSKLADMMRKQEDIIKASEQRARDKR